jgi:hypothetical protein
MLLIICEFRENRCKEGRTFHMGELLVVYTCTGKRIRERAMARLYSVT